MTRLLFWVVKHPKIAIIIVLSLVTTVGGYMAYNVVTISTLETRVAQLERSVASKNTQIRSLVSSVDTQNAQVDKWRSEAEDRAEAAQEAIRKAQAAQRESDEAVGRLQAMKAMTCEEGIELIDRALGL